VMHASPSARTDSASTSLVAHSSLASSCLRWLRLQPRASRNRALAKGSQGGCWGQGEQHLEWGRQRRFARSGTSGCHTPSVAPSCP
jgi:hypothetical protein